MLLCDSGNTSMHFYDGSTHTYKQSVEEFDGLIDSCKVYYINVNPDLETTLQQMPNWINLQSYVNAEKYYDGMGIDRIMACEAVDEGIVIDAGSAITVDVMHQGVYGGGFICPGIHAMQASYANISSRLSNSFNFELDLDKMPKNTQDSISYGFLRLLYGEVMRHNKPIIITGGDARHLHKVFQHATVDELLIFKGMKQMIPKIASC
ncbi:MAG: pantothenate kinase [Sulfurimonas sp.]|nr:MAG: pantothenate kinase [Sulfurimonas sp.]